MFCFPHTRSNNILEINEVEPCNNILKLFINHSPAQGSPRMHLVETNGSNVPKSPKVIYEYNADCIAQIKVGYIKGD